VNGVEIGQHPVVWPAAPATMYEVWGCNAGRLAGAQRRTFP
jgi:hypothetical protein